MNALLAGEIPSIDAKHTAQILVALDHIEIFQGGADLLPSEGTTKFRAARDKQHHQSFVIKALRTEKGMKQYLVYTRWIKGVNHWSAASRKRNTLILEANRLNAEKAIYNG